MVKGGILKDDADWNQLGIKDGHTFMMMGSAESDIPKEPIQKTTFVEDMTEEEAQALRQVRAQPPKQGHY
jgi:ubiquitin carboxyl-terminal hydrolase 14